MCKIVETGGGIGGGGGRRWLVGWLVGGGGGSYCARAEVAAKADGEGGAGGAGDGESASGVAAMEPPRLLSALESALLPLLVRAK